MDSIAVELSYSEAKALAEFVRRIGWSELRACASDDNEADEIRSAVDKVRRALAERGYHLR